MLLQNHSQLPVSIFSVRLGSLKRVTRIIFKISIEIFSMEQAKSLSFVFSSIVKSKNYQRIISRYLFTNISL
jgi:hypothetical protein